MRHKGKTVPGELPGYGAIFMSNTGTKKECFQRKLLGLPLAQSDFVLHVRKGMILFLFEFERRQLHGVFRATSNGEMDIEPNAYKSSGKHFPAQVRFTHVWNCNPLDEYEFKDAIRDNYLSQKKFRFGLSKDQVYKLITLFHSKRIPKTHPERNIRQYDDDKASEGNARFGDNRKNIRDRIRFVKQEDDQRFEFDEVKVDDQGYRTHKDNREKRLNHSLGGLERVNDANLHFMRDVSNENEMHNNSGELNGHFGKNTVASNDSIGNKNIYFRGDNRIQVDYHLVNSFSQSLSSHNRGTPDRGSQMIDDGGYFGQETVEREQRRLTSCKPNDVWINPNYEPIRSTEHPPYEPRLSDLSHFNQNDSDFIPISDVSDQFQLPFEFNNLGNTYDYGFLNSASCDSSSVITIHTPYDPEVPEFCHKSSYFTPGLSPSRVDNHPVSTTATIPYQSQNKHSDVGKFRSNYVRKVSVFDRLTSAPKSVDHEKKLENDELDASVNKVMKMLEKIVSSPIKRAGKRQSTFRQDNNNNKIVDYEVKNIEYEGIEGGESETRVVDFKRRKKTNKNLDDDDDDDDDESKSHVGKRRKLVRPVFVKKENETTPLKVDCYLTKTDEGQKSSMVCSQVKENENCDENTPLKVESAKNIEGQKSSIACSQVEENEKAENCEKLEEKVAVDDMYESSRIIKRGTTTCEVGLSESEG